MSRIHKYGKEPKPHRVQEYFWSKLQITGNITTISPAMWTLQHLTSLYLNDNCLSRIPAEISRLEHLMHLDLANNKILSLPAEIGELTRLRQLFLDNNQLRVLPYEIGKLCNLQYIGLQGNPLNFEIQAVYSESNGTRKLLSYMLNNLAGNITTISPAMWTLQHLTSLYLNDNCLSRIPAEISRLEHLMHLDLANNKILSLPAEIGELTRLRQLFLDNNQLRVLPYEIGKLCNLQYIGLQGNPLNFEIQAVYSESNGTRKLLSYMLNNLAGPSDMERSTEEKEEEETGPVTSLMVSPAKPSSQALSPIRKAANPRDREETSSGQVHSAVVVKSSEENVSVRPKKRRQVVQSGSAISGVSEGMPEPSLEEQLPHNTTQAFTSNVVWNFEDLHMLNGTNLPIFGEGTHPCVSLRLHDMNKPINILTGIDYWLDNLMCYVPEVRMYHLDGIVQKCQLIKTEDLPHTAESQFSLHLVRDVAQNILAFLNRKVTKEGHTYWLFKEKDDDIVKLYDLTSLCAEGRVCVDGNVEEESGQGSHQDPSDNPFTVPVAILFYRVAKNMSASEDAGSKIPTIRALLSNTLSLLDNHQYPKIVSSAHYMLSDLYVPQDVDPDSPTLSDCSEDESEWLPVNGNSDGEEDDEINKKRSRTHPHYYKAPSLQGSLEERCLSALDHATQALRCLHSSTDTNSHILLLKKISLIYLVMARANYNNKEYGLALQYLRFSFHAWQGMTCRLGDGTGSLPAPAQALTLAGDIFYMMAMHWQDTPKHVDAYNTVCDIHQEMLTLLDNIISAQECCGVIKLPCDVEEAFSLSLARLEDAIATSQPEADIMLLQRLGNVCKEIGVMYLLQSNKLCEESDVGFEELSRRSREFLDRGLAFYTRAQDKPNTALLYYFSGSLLRVRAFHHTSRGKLSEKHYYQQALKEYQRGLEVLVHRSQGEEIWDLVVLDYCDAHYAFASILHHRSTHSAKVPREAVDLLNKALKYCDENNTPGPSQPLYRDRAAVIYRKLAGIYRDALRHSRGDKRMRYLVELNYKKAAELFLLLENPVDIMELQLDRMALLEEQIQGLSSPQTLYRLHLSMLQLLVECQPALKLLQPITTSTTTSSTKARPGQQKTLGGEEEQSAKDNVEKAGDDVSVQGQSHTTTATNTTTSPTNTITLATAATTPTPTLTTSSSTTTPEVENRPIPPPDITSDKEGGRPKSVMESQAQSEKEGLARLEKDEDQAKSEDLLEMLQKKLHASLWALIKVTKNGGTGADGGIETLKQMYKESLNADSLPLPSHLLSAITAITPLLETLPHIK